MQITKEYEITKSQHLGEFPCVFNRVHIELFSRTLGEIACFPKRHKSWQPAEKYGAFAWKRIYEGKTSAYLEYQCSITSLLKIDDSNKKTFNASF